MTDISMGAVERVRKYVDHPYTSPDTLVLDSDLVQISADDLARIVQRVDAQAARIEELEAQVAAARSEALREAAKVLLKGGSYEAFRPAFDAMNRIQGEGADRILEAALLALMEEPTNG
jgi:hypothetical protein